MVAYHGLCLKRIADVGQLELDRNPLSGLKFGG